MMSKTASNFEWPIMMSKTASNFQLREHRNMPTSWIEQRSAWDFHDQINANVIGVVLAVGKSGYTIGAKQRMHLDSMSSSDYDSLLQWLRWLQLPLLLQERHTNHTHSDAVQHRRIATASCSFMRFRNILTYLLKVDAVWQLPQRHAGCCC